MSQTREKTRNDLADPARESLFDLPKDIIEYSIPLAANTQKDYGSIETTRVMATLSPSCQTIHTLFKLELAKRGAKQLLIDVLQGNEAAVLKTAKTNPSLFFIQATAQDYAMDLEGNCRTIKDWSPYQAMFGTGDKDMFLDNEDKPTEIKKCLDAYLDKTNGHAMAASQELEKFPNGFDYPPSTYDFDPIVAAITHDQQLIQTGKPSKDTLALLMEFRAAYKPGVVTVGHHFNMNDFIKANEVYETNWNPWNGKQLDFFDVYFIGCLDRLITAPYLQRACQGLQKPLTRSFEVKNYVTDKKIVVVPLDSDLSCRLGEGFVIDSYFGRRVGRGARARLHDCACARAFGKLCQANTTALSRLMHTHPKQENWCVIA